MLAVRGEEWCPKASRKEWCISEVEISLGRLSHSLLLRCHYYYYYYHYHHHHLLLPLLFISKKARSSYLPPKFGRPNQLAAAARFSQKQKPTQRASIMSDSCVAAKVSFFVAAASNIQLVAAAAFRRRVGKGKGKSQPNCIGHDDRLRERNPNERERQRNGIEGARNDNFQAISSMTI